MFKKNLKAALFIGASLMFIMFSFYFYQVFYSPNLVVVQERGEVYIPEGADIYQVLDTLNKYEYVEDVVSFMFVSKVLKYQGNVKPGRYILDKRMTNLEGIRLLRSGAQTPVMVSFNSVRLKEEIAHRLCRPLIAQVAVFDSLLTDVDYVSDLGFDTTTIATMFLPNTYEMYWTTDALELFERMKREYDRFWTEDRLLKATQLGLTPVEASILASIVQAETKKNDEKPIVAGLYLNRLEKGMTLDADPTVVFALKGWDIRRVLKKHLKYDSPYNTYLYAGLPPGPINIPEITSIDAVLNAADHDYIFMCAKEDFSGYHNFAKTLREHLRNARRFQSALNQRGIMR